MSVSLVVSNIRYNDKQQPFVIKYTYVENHRGYACVEFLDTGTTDIFRMDVVNKGQLKDRYAKDIMGMFCIGRAKKSGNIKQYNLWHHMLERCYNKNNKSFPNYGEKGVRVCERWHCFEYFLNDIHSIDGYDEQLFNDGLLQLDKDIKQKNSTSKIYSLDTCKFVSREENMKHRAVKKGKK